MRNIRKSSTLESKFPLLAVEQGCIISKDGDITVAYEVTLPEIFTVTSQEYESVHAAWCKAIKVLPDYSIVHKQDWFVKENYAPDLQNSDMSFLSRSYERHFNERPYLHHQCYLFLTKTTKERMAHQSNFSTLCRGHIIPKEIKNKETVARFLDAVEQFARIINDSGYISLRKLADDEITGTERTMGLVGKYLSLSTENVQCLEDMELSASGMRIGNKHLCLHTLSQTEDLPTEVSTDNRFERLSTDRSDCRLSFAAPVGLLLSCNHIYNQYVFIDNSDETLQKFEKTARNMHSLSRYSRQNAINKEWIDEYLNEAHSQGLQSVRAHFNVLAWGEDMEELKHLRNDVGSQLASMECVPRHNTVDCPTLFWAAIPANEGVTEQDTKVAGLAHEAGKACIIVVNKWDTVEKDTNTMDEKTAEIRRDLSYMTYAPVVFISALTGQRVDKLFDMIVAVSNQNSMRITTGMLNNILEDATARVQPPTDKGRRLKIYYITQVGVKPPHFVFFCNDSRLFHFSYQRYLENQIRAVFGLTGTPIRITIRQKGDKEDV